MAASYIVVVAHIVVAAVAVDKQVAVACKAVDISTESFVVYIVALVAV